MSPSPLEKTLSALLDKRRASSKLRSLKASPPGSVDLSSNDFLSLATNPNFKKDYLALLGQNLSSIGSTGSRLLDGNSVYAESLEKSVAAFHGAEAGLLTNSGFDANVRIFSCLPQPGDVIIYDELIHASVHDGMRQSRAKDRRSFKHNDVDDLFRILKTLTQRPAVRNVFIAVETVYSMDGDLAPLTEIASLIETIFPEKNAHLVVDEAHSTGIYGPRGAGRVCELGLEKRVSIRLHTFGKALACNGAIILCSPLLRLYLINYARPLIYTTFMSFPSLTAIDTAYRWLKSGQADRLSKNLDQLIEYLFEQLNSLLPNIPQQYREELDASIPSPPSPLLTLPTTCPKSPIFALLTPKPRELASYCQAAGFIVRPVVPPTVLEGTERVRVCLHAGNTVDQIDRFVARVRRWVVESTKLAVAPDLPTTSTRLDMPTAASTSRAAGSGGARTLPSAQIDAKL